MGDTPEAVTSGHTDESRSDYESTPWDGKYLSFPPSKRYDFYHGLRGTPRIVQAWLAFSEVPIGDSEHGNVSEGVGNEAIIQVVNSKLVRVRNDTCETFYLRLVASSPTETSDHGVGGESPGSGGTSGDSLSTGGSGGDALAL